MSQNTCFPTLATIGIPGNLRLGTVLQIFVS